MKKYNPVEPLSIEAFRQRILKARSDFVDFERGELFFHHSAVQGASFEALKEGQRVTYTEGRGPKGARAESVSPA